MSYNQARTSLLATQSSPNLSSLLLTLRPLSLPQGSSPTSSQRHLHCLLSPPSFQLRSTLSPSAQWAVLGVSTPINRDGQLTGGKRQHLVNESLPPIPTSC